MDGKVVWRLPHFFGSSELLVQFLKRGQKNIVRFYNPNFS